jgi:hypothetical protein
VSEDWEYDPELPEPTEWEQWAICINRWDGDDNTRFEVLIFDPDTEEEHATGEGFSLREAFIDLAEDLSK